MEKKCEGSYGKKERADRECDEVRCLESARDRERRETGEVERESEREKRKNQRKRAWEQKANEKETERQSVCARAHARASQKDLAI